MKHLLFFYLTVSYSIGLPSLLVLILAFLRSRIKMLIYMFSFLVLLTVQLVFLTYVQYKCANNFSWYTNYDDLISNTLSCFMIILLPLTVNEWFNVQNRITINILFGVLFLSSLALILGPFFLGMLGVSYISSLLNYKVFLGILVFTVLFIVLIFINKFSSIRNSSERIFGIFFVVFLMVEIIQFFLPFFRTFPENLIINASMFFFGNLLLLKLLIGKFFLNSCNDSLREVINELKLTEREKEVLFLLIQGNSNQKIGAQLFISEDTVKTHIKNIYKKLEVNNRVQLFNLLKEDRL